MGATATGGATYPSGEGPDGWYTREFRPDVSEPRWLNAPTKWHFRVAGVSLCPAHRKLPTRVSHRQRDRVGEPPPGAKCERCVAALAKDS